MVQTNYWFSRDEFASRVARVQAELKKDGFDAFLAFLPETVTYLTGFFTRGYSSFQFAIIPASGDPVVICRDVEEYYLDSTCVFPGRAMWNDSDDKSRVAASAITACLGDSPRLAVEMGAWTLSAARLSGLQAALPKSSWVDCSRLVSSMRLIKSPAEIAYQRKAAAAAEAGMRAGIETAKAGASERDMAAAICAAMILAGSDSPGPGVLSSGERAFHLHGGYTDRVLQHGDIVQLETTPNHRRYHARFMRPMKVGGATDEDMRTVEQLIGIQDEALAQVAPGVEATVPDRIYREGVLSAGLRETYTNKTFYSVGLLLEPNGGEPLEAAPGCTWSFAPGMTFHTYVLAKGFGMSETIAITETGYERLTNFPRQLFVT
ncbi:MULTISPECIES: M24 family metallopeptidase [unclassified Shinella]|jgi:Xaa-Pro dipeptidase|uniref:M24 family metallopeptidase n=1 Tax=unclassified Shinella TaxID=2643062 RepID=UPI0003C5551E|nr:MULTISPECIES: Xaa-Pro peptidase family protein [unclassified Shinella]MCA0340452.1 Xaa-Pro peptidase family protein [Pseudomonadota bacterium]EYR81232.1 dipeptidase [Shinella sp. DD12]MCO5151939.1 Xaa-Pro peptidase family protein [Shinella sp.]MDC7264353.1 Xaa-Pro peptidase family protein [Shinella sp. HY16]MDC7271249.1 Xaa-Pro peptidase family protein [Shinella sp. YZ44]